VIVTWNSARYIGPCLKALPAATRRPYECLVVDNQSGDGTAELVSDHFPDVTLLPAGGNLGFAAANNLALRRCRGRYVALLNPDTEARPGAFDVLMDLLERRPETGAVGPRLLNSDGSVQFSTYQLPRPATLAWEYFLRDLRRPNDPRAGRYAAADYEREREVAGLLGACIVTRRAVLEQIGYLDERYQLYCEEVDWCLRLQRAGWQLWYTPAAEVVHHGGQSTRLAPAASFLELQRSRFKLYSKWYAPTQRLELELITRAGMLYQMSFWTKQWLRGRLSRAEWQDRLALALRVLALRPSGAAW
jgi:GT2 family glycosyltransferase